MWSTQQQPTNGQAGTATGGQAAASRKRGGPELAEQWEEQRPASRRPCLRSLGQLAASDEGLWKTSSTPTTTTPTRLPEPSGGLKRPWLDFGQPAKRTRNSELWTASESDARHSAAELLEPEAEAERAAEAEPSPQAVREALQLALAPRVAGPPPLPAPARICPPSCVLSVPRQNSLALQPFRPAGPQHTPWVLTPPGTTPTDAGDTMDLDRTAQQSGDEDWRQFVAQEEDGLRSCWIEEIREEDDEDMRIGSHGGDDGFR